MRVLTCSSARRTRWTTSSRQTIIPWTPPDWTPSDRLLTVRPEARDVSRCIRHLKFDRWHRSPDSWLLLNRNTLCHLFTTATCLQRQQRLLVTSLKRNPIPNKVIADGKAGRALASSQGLSTEITSCWVPVNAWWGGGQDGSRGDRGWRSCPIQRSH